MSTATFSAKAAAGICRPPQSSLWNAFGFFATVLVGYGISCTGARPTRDLQHLTWPPSRYAQFGFTVSWLSRYAILVGCSALLPALLGLFRAAS